MAFVLDLAALLLRLFDVELTEEVEGDDSVEIHDDTRQEYRQHQLQGHAGTASSKESPSAKGMV